MSSPPAGDVIGNLVALVERQTANQVTAAWPVILDIARLKVSPANAWAIFGKPSGAPGALQAKQSGWNVRRKRRRLGRRVGTSCAVVLSYPESGRPALTSCARSTRAPRYRCRRRRTMSAMSVSSPRGKRPPINKTTTRLICQRLIQGMSMSQACATHDVPSSWMRFHSALRVIKWLSRGWVSGLSFCLL